jgi:hypothetical protein
MELQQVLMLVVMLLHCQAVATHQHACVALQLRCCCST